MGTLVSEPILQRDPAHSTQSSLRASILEHLFLGELLRTLWNAKSRRVHVLRAEVDAGGYDLVIACDSITRYIQLKSSHRRARTSRVTVNTSIAEESGGCVIWLRFDEDTMDLGPFLWFGGLKRRKLPPLGDRVGRHTRGQKQQRVHTRVLRKGDFKELNDMSEVVRHLFGKEL